MVLYVFEHPRHQNHYYSNIFPTFYQKSMVFLWFCMFLNLQGTKTITIVTYLQHSIKKVWFSFGFVYFWASSIKKVWFSFGFVSISCKMLLKPCKNIKKYTEPWKNIKNIKSRVSALGFSGLGLAPSASARTPRFYIFYIFARFCIFFHIILYFCNVLAKFCTKYIQNQSKTILF